MNPLTIILSLAVVALISIAVAINWIYSNGDRERVKRRTGTIIALIVTVVWVMGVVAGILIGSYSVSPLLHIIMGAIVGYFFNAADLPKRLGGE